MHPYVDVFGRKIPSYGLCMAIGILLSCSIGLIRARNQKLDINSCLIMVACAMGMGLFGAKVLYFIASCDIREFTSSLLRGDIRELSGGGQVFYGGLIGGIIGAALGARISGATREFAAYCKALVPVIPLGHAFGRIGCFFGGCCYGMPYAGFGAVTFPDVGVYEPAFPVQLLEAGLNIGIFLLLILPWVEKKHGFFSLSLYLVLYSVVRFILEFFRGDVVRGITHGLSTSQWISTGVFVCGIILFVRTVKKERQSVQ